MPKSFRLRKVKLLIDSIEGIFKGRVSVESISSVKWDDLLGLCVSSYQSNWVSSDRIESLSWQSVSITMTLVSSINSTWKEKIFETPKPLAAPPSSSLRKRRPTRRSRTKLFEELTCAPWRHVAQCSAVQRDTWSPFESQVLIKAPSL